MQVTLTPEILDLLSRRRGLIADIEGMHSSINSMALDTPHEQARHEALVASIDYCNGDLDVFNDAIVRLLAPLAK